MPNNIAIVGFSDDIRSKLISTHFTTVRHPAFQIGKRVAIKLIDTIEQENVPVENIELVDEFII